MSIIGTVFLFIRIVILRELGFFIIILIITYPFFFVRFTRTSYLLCFHSRNHFIVFIPYTSFPLIFFTILFSRCTLLKHKGGLKKKGKIHFTFSTIRERCRYCKKIPCQKWTHTFCSSFKIIKLFLITKHEYNLPMYIVGILLSFKRISFFVF